MAHIQRITPNLWFDKNGEEAADFYISVFKNSKKGNVSRYGKEGFDQHHMPEGTVLTVEFSLDGQDFLALNGGPMFTFSEAISFSISCNSQEEIDHYWSRLQEGGGYEQMCGWLKDRFGLSWQVVPAMLGKLMSDPDKARAGRAMNALMKMKKLNIEELERAADRA